MLSVKLCKCYKRTLKKDPKKFPYVVFVLNKFLTVLTEVKIFAKIGLVYAY